MLDHTYETNPNPNPCLIQSRKDQLFAEGAAQLLLHEGLRRVTVIGGVTVMNNRHPNPQLQPKPYHMQGQLEAHCVVWCGAVWCGVVRCGEPQRYSQPYSARPARDTPCGECDCTE